MPPRRYHVSSARNRTSIEHHGLDWTRMGAARGIAGSIRPEVDGIFLADSLFDVEWFVDMNNTGGPVDVWVVDGVAGKDLVQTVEGYRYLPRPIPTRQLTRLE